MTRALAEKLLGLLGYTVEVNETVVVQDGRRVVAPIEILVDVEHELTKLDKDALRRLG